MLYTPVASSIEDMDTSATLCDPESTKRDADINSNVIAEVVTNADNCMIKKDMETIRRSFKRILQNGHKVQLTKDKGCDAIGDYRKDIVDVVELLVCIVCICIVLIYQLVYIPLLYTYNVC